MIGNKAIEQLRNDGTRMKAMHSRITSQEKAMMKKLADIKGECFFLTSVV